MLEEHDREPEREIDLAEARGRGFEAGRIATEARPKPLRLRVEERRSRAKGNTLDESEELLDLRCLPERQGRLDRLDDALLCGLRGDVRHPDPRLEGRLSVDQRLGETPLGTMQRGP